MTPGNFRHRMEAIIWATKGEPLVRDKLATDLMWEALFTNGFNEGLSDLARASAEKVSPAAVAQAVERSRHG